MEFRRRAAHPALRGIVRSLRERRATLGSEIVAWPLTARPHQIIDIYLGDPFRLRIDGGSLQTAPQTVVVGPQDRAESTFICRGSFMFSQSCSNPLASTGSLESI
jgi:hypothetical protein